MALMQHTGLFRFNSRYFNAARAGWKTARAEYLRQCTDNNPLIALRTVGKVAGKAFCQYLQSHDGNWSLTPLTPAIGQGEQIEKYERELLAALDTDKQPDTRNIAISGAHGAHQSSFLRAFTARNPQHRYLPISLPKLTETDFNNGDAAVLSAVEKTGNEIAQQILYHTRSKKPEQMAASQPRARSWKKMIAVVAAFLTSFSVLILSYVTGSLTIDQSTTVRALRLYLPDHVLAFAKKYAPLLAEFSLFCGATLLVLFLFSGLQKMNASRVSRTRGENGTDHSVADSYLDQITQALLRSGHNVVIIDNLMSTHPIQALETLLQLNRHLNSSGHMTHPVYFIYILDDAALTVRQRTGFFDLIIPIVPAIHSAHTGSKLYLQLKTIKNGGEKVTDQMDKELIYKMADYIDDMRVLINIVNEFDVYLHKLTLHLKELNKNKLFAMMVIKNLYPQEHAELTNNTGIFWQVLNNHGLTGHAVPEVIPREVMGGSLLQAFTEERFAPVHYLLQNGYFAEDYRDYLSYFSPGAISLNDKRLSLRLKQGQVPEFSQQVDSPKALLNHVKPADLANGRGLMNGLVDYLLENTSCHDHGHPTHHFLRELFHLTEDNYPRLLDFLSHYFQSHQHNKHTLFETLFSLNRDLLVGCLTDNHSGGIKQGKLIAGILPALIRKGRSDMSEIMVPVIASLEDIQPIVRLADEQPDLWAWLQSHGIKFHRLSLRRCTQKIALRIIDHSMYQLNPHMLGLLLAFVTTKRPTAPVAVSYSAVCSCQHHRLICQTHENLKEFVNKILLAQPQLQEDQNYLVELLNSPKLTIDDKVKLLKHARQKIAHITDILDYSVSLSARLLENNLVAASWGNIRHIFTLNKKGAVNPLLVEFIAQPENTEKLALQTQPHSQHANDLLNALIHTEQLSDKTLNQLLSAFPAIAMEHLDPQRVSLARLEVIGQHPNCRFSFNSLDWLAQNESRFTADPAYRYLLRFWQEYKAEAESTAHLTVNTLVSLLSGSDIEVDEKLWLCHLLNNENEIDSRILAGMLSTITSQPADSFTLQISFHRLETLIDAAKTLPEKIRLLSQQVKYLPWPQIVPLLCTLNIEGTGPFIRDNKQFSLSNTHENLELINALRQADHIVAIADSGGDQTIRAYIKTAGLVTALPEVSPSADPTAQ